MAHEKEKAQYREDRKNHERPWELWENRQDGTNWRPCMCQPAWSRWCKYRRKESVFEPEYFSGLNWRDALPLVGKVVEFSGTPDMGWKKAVLEGVVEKPVYHFIQNDNYGWLFVRTCPETHAHPTITIGGVKLPRPETEKPPMGTGYFYLNNVSNKIMRSTWENNSMEIAALNSGIIHLTESRAQAWTNWWDETVIKAGKGGE